MDASSIFTLFASVVSLLRIILTKIEENPVYYVRDLRDQLRALGTVLLAFIHGTDDMKIFNQFKDPLIRCRILCDHIRALLKERTARGESYCWKAVYIKATHMLSTYTSTFLVASVREFFLKGIITPGIIPIYEEWVLRTISDIGDEYHCGEFFPEEEDRRQFQQEWTQSLNSFYRSKPPSIQTLEEILDNGGRELNKMVFYTAKENLIDPLGWGNELHKCRRSFKDKFDSAVTNLPDASCTEDVVGHFEHMKRREGTQTKFVVLPPDLTKSEQILDFCGVWQFYDIHIRPMVFVRGQPYIL